MRGGIRSRKTSPPMTMPPISAEPEISLASAASTPRGSASARGVSDTRLRAAKAQDKPYKIACGGGLYLEVMPSGSKLWRWKYRLGGKENRFALGAYPQTLLREAREQSEAARKLVERGVHPSHHKKIEKIKAGNERANTFELVAEEWLGQKDWESITKDRRLGMLRRLVFPHIGRFAVNRIESPQIVSILKRIEKENGLAVAAEARRSMSSVFEFAIATARATTDPVYPVRKSIPPNKTQHKRALNAEEVGDLLSDLERHGGQFQIHAAFRLMWLTLARPSEVVEAEWSEIDLDAKVWRIPAERMKKRKPHVIPLSDQACELLKGMQTLTGRWKHVFVHRDSKQRPMVTASFRQMLHVLGWAGRFSPHATRTTGSTRLNELGFSSDWIERQLAHDDPNGVRRTYNHADHLSDRATMMQKWADLLDSWAAASVERKRQAAKGSGSSLLENAS
jgi:integrase